MKQVHWQLPFGNIDGTKDYRIDIYAEGAPVGGIKQLTGAATPFTTDEDNSEDFFEPVRSQTGQINIVDEDGTLMRELIPIDNVDRPVQLVSVTTGKVVWQGFLSCEAYTQPYTERPEEVTFNVNSVLEAMKSVQVELPFADFKMVMDMMKDVFGIVSAHGSEVYRFYYPHASKQVMDKLIDTTAMFEMKEQDSENSRLYEPVGISLYDIVERLCRFMGWTAREDGRYVYMTDADDDQLDCVVFVEEPDEYETATFSSTPIAGMAGGYCNNASCDNELFAIDEIDIKKVFGQVVYEASQVYWSFYSNMDFYKMRAFRCDTADTQLVFPSDFPSNIAIIAGFKGQALTSTLYADLGWEQGKIVIYDPATGNWLFYKTLAGATIDVPQGVPFAFINTNHLGGKDPRSYMAETIEEAFYLNDYHVSGQPAYSFTVKVTNAQGSGKYAKRETINLADAEFRGTDHKVEYTQGAKSVEVVANVAQREMNLGIPACPYGDLHRKFAWLPCFTQGSYVDDYYYGAQIYASTNETAHTYIEFGYMSARINPSTGHGYTSPDSYQESNLQNVLRTMVINNKQTTGYRPTIYDALVGGGSIQRFHAGAFYGKLTVFKKIVKWISGSQYVPEDTVIEGSGTQTKCTYPDPEDGILCSFIPAAYDYGDVVITPTNNFDYSNTHPILKMRTIVYHHLSRGYINIQSAFVVFHEMADTSDHQSILIKHNTEYASIWSVGATLRFGNRYYTGDINNPWSSAPQQFRLDFNGNNVRNNWNSSMDIDKVDGLVIPVEYNMVGEVELDIWPDGSTMTFGSGTAICAMFFKALDVKYLIKKDITEADRKENHYYQLLGLHFRDEVSVKTELASNLNNKPAPSILMNDEVTYMTQLFYIGADGKTTGQRPELHLLQRLAKYYSAVRKKVSIIMRHPAVALPITKITGYLNDTDKQGEVRTYLPLSESRDWRADTSTITCFEMPE